MKSLLIFVLFAVLSSNSFAGAEFTVGDLSSVLSEPTPPTEPTIYDRIMEKYTNGSVPEFTSSIGWWSGRCYSTESPNFPFSQLLAISENTVVEGPDNGPDFPPVTEAVRNMAFIYWTGSSAPDFFDHLTDEARSSVASLVNSYQFRSYVIKEANESFYAGDSIRNTIRKFGTNFYGYASTIAADGKETISQACYFFKKVN